MQTDPSPEPTQATLIDAPKTERTDTTYTILSYDSGAGCTAWRVVGEAVAARSAEAAVRTYAGKNATSGGDMSLVAVPSRSWRPVKITTKVETSLVIEDL